MSKLHFFVNNLSSRTAIFVYSNKKFRIYAQLNKNKHFMDIGSIFKIKVVRINIVV